MNPRVSNIEQLCFRERERKGAVRETNRQTQNVHEQINVPQYPTYMNM